MPENVTTPTKSPNKPNLLGFADCENNTELEIITKSINIVSLFIM
jgi:hypothetical protein